MPTDPKDSADQLDDEAESRDQDPAPESESESESESEAPAPKSTAPEPKRARGREDDDDEPRRPRKGKRKRAKRQLPRTEAELNAPDSQTLWMLGALASMVLIMWGSARFACNAHPDETRKPREIATSEVATDPKGAAVELAQRWATRSFDGALELASGALAGELQQEKAQCEGNPQCTGEREALKMKVLTTGELLARQPTSAMVRVSSTGLADGQKSYILQLESDGKNWKANKRLPADAAVPRPAAPTGFAPLQLAPAPHPAPARSAP
jgi:hypothetical protein